MYLSRQFWQPDEERVQGAGPLPVTAGSSAAAAAPGIGSEGAAPSQSNVGTGAPGALRSFFDLNKDQGQRVLGGLAESVNQRLQNTQASLTPVQSVGQQYPYMPVEGPGLARDAANQINDQIAAYNAEQQRLAEAGKTAGGQNKAAIEGMAQDVNRLGSQEGQQSLLEQRYAGQGYTPGQARLDSWLTSSASNASPGTVGGVQQGYGAAQASAAAPPATNPNAPAQWQQAQQELLNQRLRDWIKGHTR
jgi:hypothetical protein